MFKRIDANRDINKLNLKKITDSIQFKNLLHLFPLIVNKNMEIIDGQHRLKAADALGLPIYYIQDDTITKADIASMNNNRKGWSSHDYINFWARSGNHHYVKLAELLKAYPRITIKTAINLMDKENKGYFATHTTVPMRTGQIKCDGHEMAMQICGLLKRMENDFDYIYRAHIVLSIKSAILGSNYTTEVCIGKIIEKKGVLPGIIEQDNTLLSKFKDILK